MASDNYAPCTDDGQHCANDIYAVSLPSVFPSANITWFQAQEACANSGKRLPTSAEWQVGANGTPDPGPDDHATDCNSETGSVSLTGARSAYVSARGAHDMVGNLAEWAADCVGDRLPERCWITERKGRSLSTRMLLHVCDDTTRRRMGSCCLRKDRCNRIGNCLGRR